jgi:putative ABC transport system ATP-binding protein/lipoprotein-releasing system ATP-binding protein
MIDSLIIQDLRKAYKFGEEQIHVLKGIKAEIPLNKLITLMGPSGSGKSTLMHILSGIDRADSGFIYLNQYRIDSMTETERTAYRRNKIGIIFQFFNLLNYLTILENVSVPLYLAGVSKSVAHSKAKESLKLVGLEHRINHKPTELSGGEQQRTAIARAIVNEPEIIFADEPTGNLDTENSNKIMELLIDLKRIHKFTIFMVTHNSEIGRMGEVQLFMKDGLLV